MTITAWTLRHAPVLFIVFIVLSVLGLRASFNLPLTHLPDIGDNRIILRMSAPDASISATDYDLAQPVYRALSSLPDVTSIRSQITAGQLIMTLSLVDSRQAKDTLAMVQDRLQALRPALTVASTIDEIRATSSRRQSAVVLAVTDGHGDITSISETMRDVIVPALRKIDGIAEIDVQGASQTELLIHSTASKLSSVGLTFAALNRQISQALSQQISAPVSVSPTPATGTILLSLPQGLKSVDAEAMLSRMALNTPENEMLSLTTVARVSTAPAPSDWLIRHNESPSVLAHVFAATGADLVSLNSEVEDALKHLAQSLPDIAIDVVERPAKQAIRSLTATRKALLEGSFLVIAVIALALKSWRATTVAALAIPLSVLPTLYIMHLLGLSLNIVSLLALTLASGIVVDDAIVEIENIHKHGDRGQPPQMTVEQAVTEMARPVIATSLALLAVFLPVATMPGEAGLYFQAFGYTLCIATIFSLLVSRLAIPSLALRFAAPPQYRSTKPQMRRLSLRYRSFLARILRYRWACLAMAALVACLSVVSAINHPGSFIPLERDGLLRFDVTMPPTVLPDARINHLASLERELLADKGVHNLTVIVPDQTDDTLRLLVQTDGSVRSEAFVKKALFKLADARAILLTSSGRPALILDLAAPDRKTLELAAPALLKTLGQLPQDVQIISPMSAPQAQVRFLPDPAVLRQLGLTAETLVAALQGHMDLDKTIAIIDDGERQPFQLRSQLVAGSSPGNSGPNSLTFAPVPLPDGGSIPLASLGHFNLDFAHVRLERRDDLYVLPLMATPSSASEARLIKSLVEAEVAELSTKLKGLTLLAAGDSSARGAMMSDLGRAFGSMILLLVAVLYAFFRSAAQVAVILTSLIFALSGGMLALALTGLPISLPVLIGFILLLGIVAKNAILLVDRAQTSVERHGNMAHAVISAASDRARPIIMTSFAMIAGMLPAALPWIEGSAFRQPLALTVIGGVAVSTVLSLVITPVMCFMAHQAAHQIMRITSASKDQRLAHA